MGKIQRRYSSRDDHRRWPKHGRKRKINFVPPRRGKTPNKKSKSNNKKERPGRKNLIGLKEKNGETGAKETKNRQLLKRKKTAMGRVC